MVVGLLVRVSVRCRVSVSTIAIAVVIMGSEMQSCIGGGKAPGLIVHVVVVTPSLHTKYRVILIT